DVFPDAYIDTIIIIMSKKDETAPMIEKRITNVKRFGIRQSAEELARGAVEYNQINSSHWIEDDQKRILTDPKIYSIRRKMGQLVVPRAKLLDVSRGITPYTEIKPGTKINVKDGFFGSVGRYDLNILKIVPVRYDKSLSEFKPEKYFVGPRLLIRRIISRQHRIHATYVEEDFLINKSYLPALQKDSKYQLLYILSLINSALFSRIFIWSSEVAKRDDFPQLDIATVNELPIRRISFTTSKSERERLLNNTVKLCQKGDSSEVLELVDKCLPRDKDGSFVVKKEKSDVVHDILAYLAGQMIEMNKQKREETKGFLSWLEREIGGPVDNLSNKTAIKEYHENTFDKLIEVLKKNKKKLSINPHSREFQAGLEKEFDKSVTKLISLKAKIQTTDALIDQIVYKLYGLTEDEIKIVEGLFQRRQVSIKNV
ncbi:MAG: hypothetical protein KAX16_04005, partial [Actinomycetia bacterium]|nr:hypothetical protein [Actinomycetes bacterium]